MGTRQAKGMAQDSPREFPALILHSSVVFPDDVVSIQLPDDTLRTDVIGDLDPADPRIVTVFLKGENGNPESAADLQPVAILCRVVLEGARKPLVEGIALEAAAFGEVCATRDMRIGVENFLTNGPRAKAEFVHG